MAIFLGAKGADILLSRGAVQLTGYFKRTLAEKMASLLPGEDEEMLQGVVDRLQEELTFEEEAQAGFAGIMAELARVESQEILPSLHQRYRRLAVAYFARRGSVLALQGFCNAWRDSLLCKILKLAETGPAAAEMGKLPAAYCLLATGCVGREEQALASSAEYFLIHADGAPDTDENFASFAAQVTNVLEKCGIVGGGSRVGQVQTLWHGSFAAWKSWIEDALHSEREPTGSFMPVLPSLALTLRPSAQGSWEHASTFFTLADLRGICGNSFLTTAVTDFARTLIAREQGTEAFVRLARKVTAMPVALGFFGGLRVERSGEHRGEFNVEEFALAPLVMNSTILACRYGFTETGTIPRIKKLVGSGRLDVELGDRLLRAFHEFNRQRIVQELTSTVEAPSGFYLNPENLNDEDMDQFKNGLESVATLQKIIYQVFAEQG